MSDSLYKVLFLADTNAHLSPPEHIAESDLPPKAGPGSTTLKHFTEQADACIANFQVPAGHHGNRTSKSSSGNRHGGDEHLKQAIAAFSAWGVTAVNLATEQTLENGHSAFGPAIRALHKAGIVPFGAGYSSTHAGAPLRLPIPTAVGGGALALYGALEDKHRSDNRTDFYADAGTTGVARIAIDSVPDPLNDVRWPDLFHVAYPRWGVDQAWRSHDQYQIAHRLLRKGYNLILGTGSSSLQEIERQQQRWLFYGLGDAPADPYKSGDEEFPFSSWAVLEISLDDNGERSVQLKLYPIATSSVQECRWRSVDDAQFDLIVNTLKARATNGWRFNNPAQNLGTDYLGHFISFEIGQWPVGEPPSLLTPAAGDQDPGDWTIQTAPAELVESYLDLNKISMGASMYAVEAQKRGGHVDWLSSRQAMVTYGKKKFIAYGYVATESALSVTICSDKVLTARYLTAAGVQTPATVPVASADEAVEAAQSMGGAVVVKPSDGKKSRGVTTNLSDEVSISSAYQHASSHGSEVLVQQYVEAKEEVRVIASPHEAIAVIKRVLPHVIGDGVSTIQQLIEDKNLQRELNPALRKRGIPVDDLTERHLRQQGYSIADVPPRDTWVTVRNVAGLSAGADPHEAFDTTDVRIKETAVAAVAAIPGLGWGGVDVIIEKGTGEPYVIEINTDAGYGQALFPTYGNSRNVAAPAWENRVQAVLPAPDGSIATAPVRDVKEPVLRSKGPADRKFSRALLSTVFQQYLAYGVPEYKKLSPRVLQVSATMTQSLPISTSMMTSADRSSAVRVLRHHTMTRQLLSLHGVPMVRGRFVDSIQDLQSFAKKSSNKIYLTPPRDQWAGSSVELLAQDDVDQRKRLRPGSFAQRRPTGTRLRVLATQCEALAIVTRQTKDLKGEEARAASEVAVDAVRAIPELRWAAVYVVIRTSGRPFVEGLSLNPRFTRQDTEVACSLDDFFHWLITSPGSQTK